MVYILLATGPVVLVGLSTEGVCLARVFSFRPFEQFGRADPNRERLLRLERFGAADLSGVRQTPVSSSSKTVGAGSSGSITQ